MIKGIYKICNNKNGKYYIGSDSNILNHSRWYDHKSKLKRNKHYNPHLQRAWNKYGEVAFEYKIIETFDGISPDELSKIENRYLSKAKKESDKCYNVIFGVRNYYRVSHRNKIPKNKEWYIKNAKKNKIQQKKYRKTKEKLGWRYFSVMVPADCYHELKKFYLELKSKNLDKWSK